MFGQRLVVQPRAAGGHDLQRRARMRAVLLDAGDVPMAVQHQPELALVQGRQDVVAILQVLGCPACCRR